MSGSSDSDFSVLTGVPDPHFTVLFKITYGDVLFMVTLWLLIYVLI